MFHSPLSSLLHISYTRSKIPETTQNGTHGYSRRRKISTCTITIDSFSTVPNQNLCIHIHSFCKFSFYQVTNCVYLSPISLIYFNLSLSHRFCHCSFCLFVYLVTFRKCYSNLKVSRNSMKNNLCCPFNLSFSSGCL